MKKAFTPLERKDIRLSSVNALHPLEDFSNGADPSFLTGFTLIELVVTIALLAMVIFFASEIFKVSVDAYRTSGANSEIMQKLRAITDQLNADFKGFRWAPLFKVDFGFGQSEIDGQTVDVRSDRILFFANGDFQSTMQHGHITEDKTVVGNVAGIFYGLADSGLQQPRNKILIRRQTILTADYDWDNVNLEDAGEYTDEEGSSSLSEVAAEQIAIKDWNTPDMRALISKRDLNPAVEKDLVKYMAKGVDDFSIQYVGWEYPDRNFEFNQWRPVNDEFRNYEWNDSRIIRIVPSALKFTFKLYDSKGIIKNGKIFTHIVYLGD